MKKTTRLKRTSIVLVAALLALASFQFTGSGCTTDRPNRVHFAYASVNETGGSPPDNHSVDTPGELTIADSSDLRRSSFRFGGWGVPNNANATQWTVWDPGQTRTFGANDNFSIIYWATWVLQTRNSSYHNERVHVDRWYRNARISLRTVQFVPGIPSQSAWRSNIARAADNWNNSAAHVTFWFSENSNNEVWVVPVLEGRPGALGVLRPRSSILNNTWLNGFNIELGAQRIHDYAYNIHHPSATYANTITHIMAHELGHAIGLRDDPRNIGDGQLTVNTIMKAQYPPITHPHQNDIDRVNRLYRILN